jgi:hypothetical protein
MTGRLVLVSEPLPECALCERPTKRAAWEANGSLCTECAQGIDRTIDMLPPVLPRD